MSSFSSFPSLYCNENPFSKFVILGISPVIRILLLLLLFLILSDLLFSNSLVFVVVVVVVVVVVTLCILGK
jgi:hypothetical protein